MLYMYIVQTRIGECPISVAFSWIGWGAIRASAWLDSVPFSSTPKAMADARLYLALYHKVARRDLMAALCAAPEGKKSKAINVYKRLYGLVYPEKTLVRGRKSSRVSQWTIKKI